MSVEFGITSNEAFDGIKEVLGVLTFDKTLLEVENNKLKKVVQEQLIKIESLANAIKINQENINNLVKELESVKSKRYKSRTK